MTEAKHPEVIWIDKDYFYKIEHSLYEGISFDDKEQVPYILKSKYDEIEKELKELKEKVK